MVHLHHGTIGFDPRPVGAVEILLGFISPQMVGGVPGVRVSDGLVAKYRVETIYQHNLNWASVGMCRMAGIPLHLALALVLRTAVTPVLQRKLGARELNGPRS